MQALGLIGSNMSSTTSLWQLTCLSTLTGLQLSAVYVRSPGFTTRKVSRTVAGLIKRLPQLAGLWIDRMVLDESAWEHLSEATSLQHVRICRIGKLSKGNSAGDVGRPAPQHQLSLCQQSPGTVALSAAHNPQPPAAAHSTRTGAC